MRMQSRLASGGCQPPGHNGLDFAVLQSRPGRLHAPLAKRHIRPAFTIIELLVVIAIIAILAALTTGAAMRYYSVQQQRNTEVTVTKLYEQLKNEWDTVVRLANSEDILPNSRQAYWLANYGSTGGSLTNATPGVNDNQARVIYIKLRLKQEFPMDFTEIMNPNPWDLPPLPVYKKAVADMISAGITPSNPPTATENSICLYLSLLRSRSGTPYNFDNLGSNAIASDNTGLAKFIVDGWRTPIVYFRWPTQNFELDQLDPAGPTHVYRDPQDRDGALYGQNKAGVNWWVLNHNWTPGTPIWNPFELTVHSTIQIKATTPSNPTWPYVPPGGIPFPGNGGPVPNSNNPLTAQPYFVWAYEYYMVPVIASAGPNKSWGLSPFPAGAPNPMQADTSGDDADNIYSYRLKLGASGN